MSTVPRTPPIGAYVRRSHSGHSPSRVPGAPAPVPDLLAALARSLGIAVEDLPQGSPDKLSDGPADVDPTIEPRWLD